MTTPLVTVSVEPTERLAQYVKGTSPYRAWRGVPPEGEPTLKSDIAAMLSAAPAPEGGAVSPGVTDTWAIRYQGIATREEAPAEMREELSCSFCGDPCECGWIDAEQVSHAQPPAREGGVK